MTPVAVKATLLLVDDSPANLHSLIAGLRDQYQILLATDGEQALQVAKNSLPDLILLDVMMPGRWLSGLPAIEARSVNRRDPGDFCHRQNR